jgi:hypothetical protein
MAGFCTQCGTTLAGHERFCPNCGTATQPEPTVPAPPPGASSWSAPGATAPVPPLSPPAPGTGIPNAPPVWHPPAPPGAQPTSRALAAWLQALLWISAGLLVISAITVAIVRIAAEDFYDAPVGTDFDEAQRWIDREDLGSTLSVFQFFLAIAVFVLLVVWAFQLTRAVNRHHPSGRTWSPGWAVGAWFIPLASMVLCPMILWEDEKIATAGSSEARDRWKSVRPRPGTIVWFVLWAIAGVLLAIGSDSLDRTDQSDLPSRSSVMTGYTVYIAGALIGATAAAVAALTVRHLTRLDHAEGATTGGTPSDWQNPPDPVEPSTSGWAPPR